MLKCTKIVSACGFISDLGEGARGLAGFGENRALQKIVVMSEKGIYNYIVPNASIVIIKCSKIVRFLELRSRPCWESLLRSHIIITIEITKEITIEIAVLILDREGVQQSIFGYTTHLNPSPNPG